MSEQTSKQAADVIERLLGLQAGLEAEQFRGDGVGPAVQNVLRGIQQLGAILATRAAMERPPPRER